MVRWHPDPLTSRRQLSTITTPASINTKKNETLGNTPDTSDTTTEYCVYRDELGSQLHSPDQSSSFPGSLVAWLGGHIPGASSCPTLSILLLSLLVSRIGRSQRRFALFFLPLCCVSFSTSCRGNQTNYPRRASQPKMHPSLLPDQVARARDNIS